MHHQLLALDTGGYVLRSGAGQARFGVWAAEWPAEASLLSAFSSRAAALPTAPGYALHEAMASAGATDARTITFTQLEWRGAFRLGKAAHWCCPAAQRWMRVRCASVGQRCGSARACAGKRS